MIITNSSVRFSFQLLLITTVFLFVKTKVVAQFQNIKNDVFWDTKEGLPIYSQRGGFLSFFANGNANSFCLVDYVTLVK